MGTNTAKDILDERPRLYSAGCLATAHGIGELVTMNLNRRAMAIAKADGRNMAEDRDVYMALDDLGLSWLRPRPDAPSR